jgi:hypothetical protein
MSRDRWKRLSVGWFGAYGVVYGWACVTVAVGHLIRVLNTFEKLDRRHHKLHNAVLALLNRRTSDTAPRLINALEAASLYKALQAVSNAACVGGQRKDRGKGRDWLRGTSNLTWFVMRCAMICSDVFWH